MTRREGKENSSMYAILGILTLGPQTGYDIKKQMERSTSYFWNENYGQIYPQLSKLLAKNDVTMQVETQEGKPDRKVYTLTEQGTQTLTAWLSKPMEHTFSEKNVLLLRLFFGHNVPLEINIRHIDEFKNTMQEKLQVFITLEESLRNCHSQDNNLKYWLLTTNYGKIQVKALIQWCEESIEELKS
ncbi:PadR family transcriptional regulator [Paenibacillus crassostreae]|uniref:Transcriptional regulator n=1 Tax=Paenibacillus crassostreae TaxID=1763538 RepID=A0A167FZP7_9BACL|nr:PadR family transcriptional regulator [Paenibacillus crassostreae]AOZ93909.1 transcriptional regulator [Paenibacillus crassostreae]OAB77058.1 transcriptional regulator [Paenibacillus crassostreae]